LKNVRRRAFTIHCLTPKEHRVRHPCVHDSLPDTHDLPHVARV